MEEKLIQKLKEFQSIKPEEGFVNRSRHLILSSAQKDSWFIFRANVFESLKLAAALTLGSALLFILLGGSSYLNVKNLSPVSLTSLNDQSLKVEAEKLDFQIQLGEAVYPLDKNEKDIGAKVDDLLKDLSL